MRGDNFKFIKFVFISIFFLSSCSGYSAIDPKLDLGQNWGVQDQKAFYQTSQGSQIIPYAWFLALEQSNNTTPFLVDQLQRFGYLPDLLSGGELYNPDALPVGFVRDDDDTGAWIGMTCAACHTSEIVVGGVSHRIDGAPTNADFYAFIKALSEALLKAADDDEKYRYRVLHPFNRIL